MRQRIKSISDVINEENEFEKLRAAAKSFSVVEKFYDIFPDLDKIASAVKIEKKVLYLHVENSVWRNELNLRQKLLIERINNYFKENLIKTVKFL